MSSQEPSKQPRKSHFDRIFARRRSKSSSSRHYGPKSNPAGHEKLVAASSVSLAALGLQLPETITRMPSVTTINTTNAVSTTVASQPSVVHISGSRASSSGSSASRSPVPPQITISQPPDTIDSSADPPSPTTTQAPYIATGATPPLPTSTTNTSAATTATVVTATTTIATIATVTTANNGLVKPKEPKSQGPDLWAEAFEKLSDDEKIFLGQIDSTKVTWQDHIQLLIEETKGLREASRAKAWKITWGNQEIILRDIAEKAVKWIQKFVTVGDIAVQYDPVHSALPWAAVRFVLQSAISDFETKATILIGIEKVICTIGRFTAYEKMYIGFGFEYEETLKKRLVAFYMSILRFLTKSKRFFETSTIGRAARAILPDKFSEYLSDLQTDEIEALKDVEVVKAQRVHDKDISHLGKLEALKLLIDGFTGPISRIDTIVESISDNLSKQERGEALQWASSINHHHQHEFVVDTITPGTCTWLHDNAKFLEWRKSSSSSIFWLKGDAGSGKTRLTASVVRLLLDERENSKSHDCIAYFYSDGKGEDQSRTTAESISGSLLKQMATLHPGSPLQLPIAEEYRKRVNAGNHKTSPTFTEVCKMINDIAVGQLYPSITIIIDAMDECQNEARWDLTTWLADLVQVSNCLLKIFVSSRPHEVDLNIQLENVPKHYIELQDTSEDVKIFIATKMQDYLNKKRFLPREPWSEREKAKMKVVTELQTKCRGMFLWADLQMKELCRLTSASEVDACLLKLPKTLEATYKHIIAQIKEAGDLATKAAITAFLWLLGTLTPLKPTELLGAVREKTSANLNLDSLLEICRNLLVLDRKEYVIRFLHLSVVEFLRQADEHFLGVSFQPQETINSVAMDCLDFLGATDGRATFFDPVYLSIFCLRGYDMPDIRDFPHEKYPHLDKLDYIMQYETNGDYQFHDLLRPPRLQGLAYKLPPSLVFCIFVYECLARQLRRCAKAKSSHKWEIFSQAVKEFFGSHRSPSERLQRVMVYGRSVYAILCHMGDDQFDGHGSRLEGGYPWSGFLLYKDRHSFLKDAQTTSPLFLAYYIGATWYLEWLNSIEGPLQQYTTMTKLNVSSSFFLETAKVPNWNIPEYEFCFQSFKALTTLPGFQTTESETIYYLYCVFSFIDETSLEFMDSNIESWISCVSTIIQNHKLFNVNPYLVGRWALYLSASMYREGAANDVFLGIFASLSDVSLYNTGAPKDAGTLEAERRCLLDWLIHSQARLENDIHFTVELGGGNHDLVKNLPLSPLHIVHLSTRSRGNELIQRLQFWLENGANPNEVGHWGTLGHFLVTLFIGDIAQPFSKKGFAFGPGTTQLQLGNLLRSYMSGPVYRGVEIDKTQFTEALELLVAYGGDLNLRHGTTRETALEYACRLAVLEKSAEEAMEILLDLKVSITQHCALNAIQPNNDVAKGILHNAGYMVEEEAEALLEAFNKAVQIGSAERVLEIIEGGLNLHNVYADFDAFESTMQRNLGPEPFAGVCLNWLWETRELDRTIKAFFAFKLPDLPPDVDFGNTLTYRPHSPLFRSWDDWINHGDEPESFTPLYDLTHYRRDQLLCPYM